MPLTGCPHCALFFSVLVTSGSSIFLITALISYDTQFRTHIKQQFTVILCILLPFSLEPRKQETV
jgi:hypothetical protein